MRHGVAFAPTSCGVALAPTEGGYRGGAGRGECDSTSFCVAGAVVLEVGKDRFPALTVSLRTNRNCYGKSVPMKLFGMLRSQIHFR